MSSRSALTYRRLFRKQRAPVFAYVPWGHHIAIITKCKSIEEALYLTKFASKVYIIHRRDELRADKIIQQRAFKNPQVEFVYNSIPLEIVGANMVTSVVIKNVQTNQIKEIKTNGVFPYIGLSSNSELFASQLQTDKNGFVVTDCAKCSRIY